MELQWLFVFWRATPAERLKPDYIFLCISDNLDCTVSDRLHDTH